MQLAFRLPYQRLVLRSPLAPSEARRALESQLADVAFYKNPAGKAFRGRFEGERFRCSRVTPYRNVFLPVVRGHLVAEGTGTRVELLLHTPPFGSAFLTVWTLGILAVLVGGTLGGRGSAPGAGFWLLTVPLLGIGFAIAGFAFGSEAVETIALLERCLRVSRA
ncbi:MAG: hypothetical protein QM778_36200 [Myxococcales bacterium]